MRVGLHDADQKSFPNYALMKISAYHKNKGDSVEWWNPLFAPDCVYSSKVFTFTKVDAYLPKDAILGGTGYDIQSKLSDEIETCDLDYSIYPDLDYCVGFLTRGCPNKCGWCVVPEKEGDIKPYRDIEEVAVRRNVVLMDNNILASDHGIRQLEKAGSMDIRIDVNQALDARRIDKSVASVLGKCKWYKRLRLACDTSSMKDPVAKAVKLLRDANVKPTEFTCYVLVKDDIEEAHDRVMFLKSMNVSAFAMPYRDFKTMNEPSKQVKRFARWVNQKAIFKTVKWENYKV